MCSWYNGWYCALPWVGHAWAFIMCRYGPKAGTGYYKCARCCITQGDSTCGGYA